MFKKLRSYIKYRKFIEENENVLINDFNVKIDNLYRLGSKIKIPEKKYEVLINYKNSQLDFYKSLNEETKKYINSIDKYFMRMNVNEFFGLYSAERTGVNEVTVIISFKKFNVVKLANIIRVLILLSLISLPLGIMNLNYMIPGLSIILLCFFINKILFKKLFV